MSAGAELQRDARRSGPLGHQRVAPHGGEFLLKPLDDGAAKVRAARTGRTSWPSRSPAPARRSTAHPAVRASRSGEQTPSTRSLPSRAGASASMVEENTEVDVARVERGHAGRHAAERHVQQVDAGERLSSSPDRWLPVPTPPLPKRDLAGLRLRLGEIFRQRRDRAVAAHRQHDRHIGDQADRRELERIERQVRVQRRRDRDRRGGEQSSVWPSGAAWATADAPIEPPAPPRFSMMNVPLVCAPSRSFISRAGTSTGPPAANGTMTRTALDGGHSWAVAAGAETCAATISAEAEQRKGGFHSMLHSRRPSPARPICRSRH